MTPEQEKKIQDLYALISGLEDIEKIEKSLSGILQQQNQSISNFYDTQKEIYKKLKERKILEQQMMKWQKELSTLNGVDRANLSKLQKNQIKYLENYIAKSEKTLKLLKEETEIIENNANIYKAIGNSVKDNLESFTKTNFSLKSLYDYFIEFDGQVKRFNLALGVTGNKAEAMRNQFQQAVNTVGHLGTSIGDLIDLQRELADISGVAREYSENELVNINFIAKGLGLSNSEAAKFVGLSSQMGKSIQDTKEFAEGTANQFSKLGLNSGKVFKTLINNIDKLNKYRFTNGIEGLKEMVKISERLKIDLEGAFSASEKFRTLEGLLETTATLNVLGGEFAKIDGFRFSFLARNKPQEFALELSKLSKGFAVLNKQTGEFDISDIGYDKLRIVAEATGQDFTKLVEQAKQFTKLDLAKNSIFIGTKKEREMLSSLAEFKKGSNSPFIKVDGKIVQLSQLTKDHLAILTQQNISLQKRAEDARTFDDVFKNTISQIKASLLPVLEVINYGLGLFNDLLSNFKDENGKLSKWAALIPVGGIILGSLGIAGLKATFSALGSLIGNSISRVFSSGGAASGAGSSISGLGSLSMATAANVAALGVAILGVGAGFYLAAKGASFLGETISKLTSNQMIGLVGSITAIGLAMTGILVGGILAVGAAGTIGSVGILAVGAAALMLGGGIGIAALGVSKLVESFGKLKDINMLNIGMGIAAIGASAALLSNPLSLVGMASLATGLYAISSIDFSNLKQLENVNKILEVDSDRIKELVNLISKINSIETIKLKGIEDLFKNSTIKVEFDKTKNATLENNITLVIDNETFKKKVTNNVLINLKKGTGFK